MAPEESNSPISNIDRDGTACIVNVTGDVDLNCSVDFQRELLEIFDETPPPKKIIINLAGVPYMDSSGVASLVKLLSRTRKAGMELFLAAPNERVKSVFEITRLSSVFTICASVEEASG